MTDEQTAALWRLEQASKKVKLCLGMKQGGAGAEKSYSQAYQYCVSLGIRQQIRSRYR
jgi:predicted type IV restriction endonuclease